MAIRAASDADLAALAPLLRGYCDFYESRPSDEELERMARAVIAAPEEEAFLLVATDEGGGGDESGEVVGFALCGWKWSSLRAARIVVLEDLYVAERARGNGHADTLIEAAGEVARRHGAPALAWYTMPDNRRAQAVYDRVGAKPETLIEYELELGR